MRRSRCQSWSQSPQPSSMLLLCPPLYRLPRTCRRIRACSSSSGSIFTPRNPTSNPTSKVGVLQGAATGDIGAAMGAGAVEPADGADMVVAMWTLPRPTLLTTRT